jgi:hypothetical protein
MADRPISVDDLEALAARIDALSPPDQLRLAAELMEARRGDLAQPIIARVAKELGAVLALAKIEKMGRRG